MYYPNAFSEEALHSIEEIFSAKDRIEIDEEDALYFACNAITIKNTLILNHASTHLEHKIRSFGYRTIFCPIGEFLKEGGGNKCLALSLSNN